MNRVAEVLAEAKALARKYRNLTGRPLGITGEVAEFTASQILGLELADARQSGFDAYQIHNDQTRKVQIKGRCVRRTAASKGRVGSIDLEKEWDTVILVLLDENMEPMSIYEATRDAVEDALTKPGSKARNERGSLAISKFKAIGREIWNENDT